MWELSYQTISVGFSPRQRHPRINNRTGTIPQKALLAVSKELGPGTIKHERRKEQGKGSGREKRFADVTIQTQKNSWCVVEFVAAHSINS